MLFQYFQIYSQSWQSEDTWSHILQKSIGITTYRKHPQVLFTKFVFSAFIKSPWDAVWNTNTDNFRWVVIAKLTHAASAWRGFTKASDRPRIDAVLRRSKRCGYYAVRLPMFEELCENTDDQLFNKTVESSNHVLHIVLPPPSVASQHYNLRRRTHSLSLPDHDNYLSDCIFL